MISLVASTVVQAEPIARDGLAIAADVAAIVVAVAVVVAALILARAAAHLNRTLGEMRRGVQQNLGPVSDRARLIGDNVEFITQALRTDVVRLNASVKALSGRLQQASDHMEERIEDFNALMEVVQSEAEDIFLDTAATVRGVREGARSISAPEKESPRAAPDGSASVDAGPHRRQRPEETPVRTDPSAEPLDSRRETSED